MTRPAVRIRLLAVALRASLASAAAAAIGAAPARADRVPPAPPTRTAPTPRDRQQPTEPTPPSEPPAEQTAPPRDGAAPPAEAPDASEPPSPEEPPSAPSATPPAPAAPALRPSPGPLDPTPGDYPPLGSAGERSHDPGLFLRFLLGPAALTAQTGSRSLSGGGLDFGAGVGAAVRRDLIVQIELVVGYLGDPTYEADGETMDRDFTAVTRALGPGATYYFANNFYATGAVYASWLERTETRQAAPDPADPFGDPGTEEVVDTSDTGIGASLTVGKEWWLTESWGLGIAARAYLASMPDADSADTTWGVRSFSLLFSATMN